MIRTFYWVHIFISCPNYIKMLFTLAISMFPQNRSLKSHSAQMLYHS